MPDVQKNKDLFSSQILKNTYNSFTITEKSILAYLLKLIKPSKNKLTAQFSIKSLTKTINIKNKPINFKTVMVALEDLDDKSFYIKKHGQHYDLWRWLNDVSASPKMFFVSFNPTLKDYLINDLLSTQDLHKFSEILPMQSKFSIRLFNLLCKDLKSDSNRTYSLSKLHKSLQATNKNHQYSYPKYADFKRRVILPATKEINQFTDFNLNIAPVFNKQDEQAKHHRKVEAIKFSLKDKRKE